MPISLARRLPALPGLAAAALAAGMLHGCAATGGANAKSPPAAQIEVQEDVGFTITEEVRADGGVRLGYEEAVAQLRQGELAAGIAALEQIVADAPGLSAPLIDLGIAEHRAGNLEAAERHLAAALELSPDHPIAHNELGIIHRKSGRFDAARASYERALSVFPGYHFARRNLAVLCDLYLGDLDCALDHYEAYMETVPEDEQASLWIADIRMRLDRGDGR